MRIDIVQQYPLPEVPKVPEGSNTSTNYDNDFKNKLKQFGFTEDGKNNGDKDDNSFKDEIDKINKKIEPSGRKIQFEIHKNPNQIIAQIVDSNTNQVIEEIPSEKMMDMIASLNKLNGQNMDKKV